MSAPLSRERFAALVLTRLAALVATLVRKGWPDLSPWWKSEIERFIRSGARQLVARVGRRGGKSSTACVFAVAFALVFSTLKLVPPGDTGWIVFLSVRREEALSRLATIEAILRAIGVKFSPGDGDAIVLDGTNIGFRVQAATVAAVSGWTSILIVADEVAKWSEASTGANPATEVLASLRPTMATQPLGCILLISSPFATEDAHARAFDAGESDFQIVAFAPTWIANPTITEAETHRLEPDPKIHAREYGAIPGASASAAFEAEHVTRAFRRGLTFAPHPRPLLLIDASGGKNDAFTWGIAQVRKEDDGHERIRVGAFGAYDRRTSGAMTSDAVLDWLASSAKEKAHVTEACGDGYSDFLLIPALRNRGINYTALPWTADAKATAVARVRAWLRDGVLVLEDDEEGAKLRSELLSFREKLLPSGIIGYGARNGGHDDRAALLLNLAMADARGLLSRATDAIRVAPVVLPPVPTGFEDIVLPSVITGPGGASRYRNAGEAADAIRDAELQKWATANASPNDHATTFVPIIDRDPLEGF